MATQNSTHIHSVHATLGPYPFTGPVGRRYNPMAHGNVVMLDVCECGATRARAVNGVHEECGEWDLDVASINPQACACTAADARRYLVALAESSVGREALEDLGYGAVAERPDRGDDYSTLEIARRLDSYLTAFIRTRRGLLRRRLAMALGLAEVSS